MKEHGKRVSGWVRLAAVSVMLAAALPGGTTLAREITGGEPHYAYLPLVRQMTVQPANLVNGSFEMGWTDIPPGNQIPMGWSFYSPEQGVTMPFPYKMQQGNQVLAVSNGPGEYVHKLYWQLPENERVGGTRALILQGEVVYKAFGGAGPHALQLSQTLTGTPGTYIHAIVYILGETHDSLPLEDDHFVAAVRLGDDEDKRVYAQMIQNYDIPGNERPWNRFEVTAQVPAHGELVLMVIVQQNWFGRVDFFMDNFSAERINGGP